MSASWENWEETTRRELEEIAADYTAGRKRPGPLNKIRQNAVLNGWNVDIMLKDGSRTEYRVVMERLDRHVDN